MYFTKRRSTPDDSTPWYERYANLDIHLKTKVARSCLEEQRAFLTNNLDIYVNHLPIPQTIMWVLKQPRSLLFHMEERYSRMEPIDLITHVIFSEALLAKKGRTDFSWIKYYRLFSIFQYLLATKISNEADDNSGKDISDVRLFDFDAYDAVYASLKENEFNGDNGSR